MLNIIDKVDLSHNMDQDIVRQVSWIRLGMRRNAGKANRVADICSKHCDCKFQESETE